MEGRKSIIVVSLLALFTGIGLAQVPSGSIVGLVLVLALDTNIKSETKTNVSGEYIVPYLPPGQYSVTVAREGFFTAKGGAIELATAQTVPVDMKLQLGSVSSTVSVGATLKELQTESGTVQHTLGEALIQALPHLTHVQRGERAA
jgi:hypothetical protein